jgi:hypothetical protein
MSLILIYSLSTWLSIRTPDAERPCEGNKKPNRVAKGKQFIVMLDDGSSATIRAAAVIRPCRARCLARLPTQRLQVV